MLSRDITAQQDAEKDSYSTLALASGTKASIFSSSKLTAVPVPFFCKACELGASSFPPILGQP